MQETDEQMCKHLIGQRTMWSWKWNCTNRHSNIYL